MSEEPKRHLKVPEFLHVPWSVRDLVVFGVSWLGTQIAIIFLLGFLAPSVPAVAAFMQAVRDGNVTALFALNLLDALIGFGLVSLYLYRYKASWSKVGWRRVDLLKTVGYIFGILVVFTVAANVLLWLAGVLVPGFDPNQAQENEFIGAADQHQNLALIALVLLPPILEETIFRGFMFPAIAKRTGVIWGAVLSSLIFGVAHFQANVGVYTFILGLLLCFMYVRLRSIVPGIFLHMVNNYLAFLAFTGPK